jgi:hypothetical protein
MSHSLADAKKFTKALFSLTKLARFLEFVVIEVTVSAFTTRATVSPTSSITRSNVAAMRLGRRRFCPEARIAGPGQQ